MQDLLASIGFDTRSIDLSDPKNVREFAASFSDAIGNGIKVNKVSGQAKAKSVAPEMQRRGPSRTVRCNSSLRRGRHATRPWRPGSGGGPGRRWRAAWVDGQERMAELAFPTFVELRVGVLLDGMCGVIRFIRGGHRARVGVRSVHQLRTLG